MIFNSNDIQKWYTWVLSSTFASVGAASTFVFTVRKRCGRFVNSAWTIWPLLHNACECYRRLVCWVRESLAVGEDGHLLWKVALYRFPMYIDHRKGLELPLSNNCMYWLTETKNISWSSWESFEFCHPTLPELNMVGITWAFPRNRRQKEIQRGSSNRYTPLSA